MPNGRRLGLLTPVLLPPQIAITAEDDHGQKPAAEPPADLLDPVVERTREAREALARRCNYDLNRMFELFREMQREHPERVRSPRSSRSNRPS